MINGINHVTLVVSDLGRALAFYQGNLGFTLRAQGPAGAYLEARGLWLALELGNPSPRADDSHIAFCCTPENFQRLSGRLKEAPVWKMNRSEGASLYVLDPDGHKLELHVGSLETRLAAYRAKPQAGIAPL